MTSISSTPDILRSDFKTGLGLFSRLLLGLLGILGLRGLFRDAVTFPEGGSAAMVSVALALLVLALLLAVRLSRGRRKIMSDLLLLVPGCFLVALLPLPWPGLLYLGLLGAGALFLLLWPSKSPRSRSVPPSDFDVDSLDEEACEALFEEGVSQQLVRKRTPAGKDVLEGTFLVEFPEDLRLVSLHVPFCPAFQATPHIETCLLDDVPARLGFTEAYPYGVRIDIRRDSTEATCLHFVLTAEEP